MIGTGLAILAAGLAGAGASIYGANKAANTQADAANNAASIQAQGQQRALDFQQGVFNKQSANFDESKGNVADATGYLKSNYDTTAGNLQPFINSGVGANNLLAGFYGVGGDKAVSDGALAQFMKSPDYQFALKGGTEALDNSAAAKGSALSGNQIRAQTEYGSGLATQNLSNYLTRLSGMSTQGQGAAASLGGLGASTGASMLGGATNMASIGAGIGGGIANTNAYTNLNGSNNVAQSVMGAGTANASGTLGMVKGFDSGLNSLSLYNQLGKSSYGGGSSPNYLSSYNGNQIGGLY